MFSIPGFWICDAGERVRNFAESGYCPILPLPVVRHRIRQALEIR